MECTLPPVLNHRQIYSRRVSWSNAAFDKDLHVGTALHEHDYADQGSCLARTVNIVLKDMLIMDIVLQAHWIWTIIPHCFSPLVGMILRGPNIIS